MKNFEWDENKRNSNVKKHGIDFIDAIKVFSDMDRIEYESERNGEKRIETIGMVNGCIILLVVYLNRADKKRIISARIASKKERESYFANRLFTK